MPHKPQNELETPHDPVTPTTPLRLAVAARIAFPDGSMKLAGLRREIARGRLSYEVIAGKHYTTLSDIEDMRRLCRIQANAPGAESSRRASLAAPADIRSSEAESSQERLRAGLQAHRSKRQRASKAKPVPNR